MNPVRSLNRYIKLVSLGLVAGAFLSGTTVFANRVPDHDLPGSKDDSIVTRYPGSFIVGYLKKPFDETDLIAGTYKNTGAGKVPYQTIHVEGAITRIVYLFPEDRSAVD